MPVISIYGKKTIIPATKKLGKELIKEASPGRKLRVCAYVRVPTTAVLFHPNKIAIYATLNKTAEYVGYNLYWNLFFK